VALPALLVIAARMAFAGPPAPPSTTFEVSSARVRQAADLALRDGQYVVSGHGQAVTGNLRRKTSTMEQRAAAIEELRRISRFDPAQLPEPGALREYRVTQTVTVTQVGEARTSVTVHTEIVTLSDVPTAAEGPGPRMAFPSLGVVEEETLLRMREHLAEPATR
jgi:hypothetical protein